MQPAKEHAELKYKAVGTGRFSRLNGQTKEGAMKRKVITGEWFYYPHTKKWYRFIDTKVDGGLLSRVCQESIIKPSEDTK